MPADNSADITPHAFARIKQAIQSDPEYAWAWFCNLSVPIMDATGLSHRKADAAAALIMSQMFECDVTADPRYTSEKSPQQEYFEMRRAADAEGPALPA